MSTLHKVKAYFGMAPMDDYDDEYYDDEDRGAARGGYSRRPREERFDDEGYSPRGYDPREPREYDEVPGSFRGGYHDDARFEPRMRGPREFDRTPPRFPAGMSGMSGMRGSTRGALAMDPRRMAELFEAGSPLSKITTLRPKDYSEARTIGERFRDGTPVIMDLVSMDNADAKRLVDFAAGLAFALRGSFDKVATKVFLLSPADVDVTAEERRRIAEAGFYSYQ
jgi:cell division inhibitor SepF